MTPSAIPLQYLNPLKVCSGSELAGGGRGPLSDFDDIELTYQLHDGGDRERVVLVHASPFVSWYGPLLEQLPELSTLTYRRHLRRTDGGRTARSPSPRTPPRARLMDHVGWARAHIVGHSYGALVALQLAMDSPSGSGPWPCSNRRPRHLQLGGRRRRPRSP